MSTEPSRERSEFVFARMIAPATHARDVIALTYDGRLLRRRRLQSDAGRAFIADLPETVSVKAGDAFVLDDGSQIAVVAAPEDLMEVRGDLPRLAWHIGNRHTPCEIRDDHLRVATDHVLADMLQRLGATVTRIRDPFQPEGGAYGQGRTFAHSHGGAHEHSEPRDQ